MKNKYKKNTRHRVKKIHRDIFCFENKVLVRDLEKVLSHMKIKKNNKNMYDETLLKFILKLIGKYNSNGKLAKTNTEIKKLKRKQIENFIYDDNDLFYEIKIRSYNMNARPEELRKMYYNYLNRKYYKYKKENR